MRAAARRIRALAGARSAPDRSHASAEISAQAAAHLLNVSRPYLINLLEHGEIPCRLVGRHRRVGFDDLMAYRRADDRKRKDAADELTRLDQELGLA